MDSDYLIYRAEQIKRSVQILRQTLERRYAGDEVIRARLDDLDIEVSLLVNQTKEK